MRFQLLRFLGLATVGILTGFVLAITGLPYGRADYRALAELYHGATDTTGQLRRRVELDLHYIENWSLLLDLKILALTCREVIKKTNAY